MISKPASRTINTKRNILASSLMMAMQMLFQFVSRSIIVYALGEEYLGLSSLFTSILQVLNIAELGFSSSVIYFMYKPIAEGNKARVCALLSYLRYIYRIVGTIIFVAGIVITPFVPHIIKGTIPDNINVYFLYFLYLLNTSISYFLFAYKTSLLTALQRLDITKIVNCIVIIFQYSIQIIALLVFHNYYLFVACMIIGTALVNIFNAVVCRKVFPEYNCFGTIEDSSKKEILAKVKGLMICNISGVTYTSLDSIIISAFIGLSSVAIYNNYIVIYSALLSLITLVRHSMQASVGNSIATESIEKNYEDLKLWQFLFSAIATLCIVGMICLYQPFMTLWMGSNMLLPMFDVILICAWFMIGVVQQAYFLYLTGSGLWDEMKWSYVFNTCCNLLLNIILGKNIGITGIIIASFVSCFISGTFWQCFIVFKFYFKRSAKHYILRQFWYFGIAAFIVVISYFSCGLVKASGILEIVYKAIICFSLSALLLFVFNIRSPYLKQSKHLLMRLFHR